MSSESSTARQTFFGKHSGLYTVVIAALSFALGYIFSHINQRRVAGAQANAGAHSNGEFARRASQHWPTQAAELGNLPLPNFSLIDRMPQRSLPKFKNHVNSKDIPKAPRWKGDVTSFWKKCYTDKLALGRLCNDTCMKQLHELPSSEDLQCYSARYPHLIPTGMSSTKIREHWYAYGLPLGLNPFCYEKVQNLVSMYPRTNREPYPSMYVEFIRHARLIFVINHKAASSSLHVAISKVFGQTWESWNNSGSHSDPKLQGISKYCVDDLSRVQTPRSTTQLLDAIDIMSSFVFSFVRHPMEKFISGVKEVIAHPGKKGHIYRPNSSYADATQWIGMNEHLMSSAFHLLSVTNSYDFLDYDAVIQIEHLSNALPELLRRVNGLSNKQRNQLIDKMLGGKKVNVKEKTSEGKAAMSDPTKGRSPHEVFKGNSKAIMRFCNHFGWDYICFGYDLPAECSDAAFWF